MKVLKINIVLLFINMNIIFKYIKDEKNKSVKISFHK